MAGRPRRRARLAEAGELVPVERERHGDGCACRRCSGWESANQAAVRHGSYASPARLSSDERTQELADGIRRAMPVYTAADEPAVQMLAITMRRVERATEAIEAADAMAGDHPIAEYLADTAPKLLALRDDLRGWLRLSARLAGDLGMTPMARARLSLDLVRTEDALAGLMDEGRRIRLERDGSGG